MLKEDKNQERIERHKITQEDFTPINIVEEMIGKLPEEIFKDLSHSVLDPSCGIGNFLTEILKRKLANSNSFEESIIALKSIYGVEIMSDNIEECRNRLYNIFIEKHKEIVGDIDLCNKVRVAILSRIIWCDALKFNYSSGFISDDLADIFFKSQDGSLISFKEREEPTMWVFENEIAYEMERLKTSKTKSLF